jgi:hypothetical protein
MTREIIDVEQRSPEWFAARAGLVTASEFSSVMAGGEGKTRASYMLKLAGEILTGEPMAEGYMSQDMLRGIEMEAEARDYYAFTNRCQPQQVGFVRNGRMGCSPDSLIGADGGLEIKSAAPHVQIARLLKGGLPSEHKAQVHGVMMVAELQWLDFVSYSPKLPALIVRVTPDPEYHAWLRAGIDGFLRELDAMVAKIRSME